MFVNFNDLWLDVGDGEVGRLAFGIKDTSEVRWATTVGEIVADAIAGAKAVDRTEKVLLFFMNVWVDRNIADDLKFDSIVKWWMGCTNWLGKWVEALNVRRLFMEGKGYAGIWSAKYVELGLVFDAHGVDDIV